MKRPRGTGSILKRRRSPFLWIQYYINGKAYRESAHTTDERKANRLLQRRLAEVSTGTFLTPKATRVCVEELAEDFLRDYKINRRKSLEDAEARWRLHLKPTFGHLRANEVGSDLINRYVDARQQDGASSATINREMAALKRMYHLGQQATPPKILRVPTFPKLAERNVRKGFVEDNQYKALAEECAKEGLWLRAMFEVGHSYGWRVSELENLRVQQVELTSRTIRLEVGETKSDEGRTVVMTNLVYGLLQQCVSRKRPDDYVFTRPNGKPIRDFRGTWEKVCKRAGVPNLMFHDLRRTGVRNMVRSGIPERVAMTLSGHKTRSVFDRYNIVSEGDLREAAKKLDQAKATREFSGTDSGTDETAPKSVQRPRIN